MITFTTSMGVDAESPPPIRIELIVFFKTKLSYSWKDLKRSYNMSRRDLNR
jgi:hypothetical protein